MFIIKGTYNGITEDIDEFESREEAYKMLAEYRLAYGSSWHLCVKWRMGKLQN